ncbi:MAG: hypothetical protein PHY65_10015 [Bacteroidales bacterium]|nr:hypothetical protein [Bacteroidales bacterium]
MNKYDKRHQQQVNNYAAKIDGIYRQAMTEFGLLAGNGGVILSADKVFDFDNYPKLKKQADKIIADMTNEIETVITNGIQLEWALSNDKNDILCNKAIGGIKNSLSDQQLRKYYNNNEKALQAFKSRQAAGLGLSDRVWNYTNQFKTEIEMGIDLGLRDGLSAAEMSRDLRKYLKYPDKLFRRVRDEHGQLHLSQAAKAFNPGQGVYRSSYKNALRLTRTETNMAYHTADFVRWQELDFIVGIEIQLSGNHPVVDICDELKGKYPKDFKFVGWHPQCRCHAVPILKTPEEMEADNERIMNGEELNGESVNRVDDVPQQFKQWTTDNEKRLTTAKSIPYFLSDNPQYTGVTMEKYTAKQIENAKRNYNAMLKMQTLADYDVENIGRNTAEQRMEHHNRIVSEILAGNKELEREWKLFFLKEEVKADQKLEASKAKLNANKKASADILAPIKAAKKIGEFGKWLNTAGNPFRKQHFSKKYTQESVNAFLTTL